MTCAFDGEIFIWRGPSPFYFVAVPAHHSRDIQALAGLVTYGWGMIPVTVRVGRTTWTTSLFPKDGGYVVPLKDKVRAAESLDAGDVVTVQLSVEVR